LASDTFDVGSIGSVAKSGAEADGGLVRSLIMLWEAKEEIGAGLVLVDDEVDTSFQISPKNGLGSGPSKDLERLRSELFLDNTLGESLDGETLVVKLR
jgi:hypothetical protein